MLSQTLLALAASASCVAAQSKGFNYASNGADQQAFTDDLSSSKSLPNATGFNSMRLYTMIQDATTDTPIEAIPAAIKNKGTLLLGLWASGGQAGFTNEISALKNAIQQYGDQGLADAVVGISCGSEDLYRITYTSQVVNKDPNPGVEPDVLVDYIKQVRDAIKGTVLAKVPVGHVDTYTAFTNSSNQAVIDNCDFLGMDAYPYYQTTVDNSIDNAKDLFFSAYDQTKAAAGSAQVWVTETGWPYEDKSGKTYNKAVASLANAKRYWQEVGCELFGKTNTWWYDLASTAQPAFGIRGTSIDSEPMWDLSCDSTSSSSSSSSASPSKTGSSSTKTSGSSDASSTSSGSSSSGSGSSSSSSGDDSSGLRSGSDSSSSDSSSSSGSGSDSSSSSGSSGSGSSSGSSSDSSSGSSGSGSGSAPYPAGSNSTAAGTGGVSTPTPSTTGSVPSSFTGAANRNAEIGAGAAAVLGLLSYLL